MMLHPRTSTTGSASKQVPDDQRQDGSLVSFPKWRSAPPRRLLRASRLRCSGQDVTAALSAWIKLSGAAVVRRTRWIGGDESAKREGERITNGAPATGESRSELRHSMTRTRVHSFGRPAKRPCLDQWPPTTSCKTKLSPDDEY